MIDSLGDVGAALNSGKPDSLERLYHDLGWIFATNRESRPSMSPLHPVVCALHASCTHRRSANAGKRATRGVTAPAARRPATTPGRAANNISERDLRPTKTQQKISGRLTSQDTTKDRLAIRSYIDTARKQGINVMTALRQAITGNSWTPPLPAPT